MKISSSVFNRHRKSFLKSAFTATEKVDESKNTMAAIAAFCTYISVKKFFEKGKGYGVKGANATKIASVSVSMVNARSCNFPSLNLSLKANVAHHNRACPSVMKKNGKESVPPSVCERKNTLPQRTGERSQYRQANKSASENGSRLFPTNVKNTNETATKK